MAKPSNAIDIGQIAKINKTDFSSASESNGGSSGNNNGAGGGGSSNAGSNGNALVGAGKGSLNPNAAIAAAGGAIKTPNPKSPFTKPPITSANANKESNGIFGDIMCCSMPPLALRKNQYGKAFLRDINLSMLNIDMCKNAKAKSPVDSTLRMSSYIKRNPYILTGDKEAALNGFMRSELGRNTKLLGLSASSILCCVLKDSGKSVYAASNGGTMSNRNKLRKLLNQTDCSAAISKDLGLSSLISRSTGSALIDVLLSGDPSKAEFYAEMAVNTLGMRNTFLGSLAMAIATGVDVKKKLVIVNKNKDRITAKDRPYLNVPADKVLNGLKDDKIDYDDLKDGLDILDPNWSNKDDIIKDETLQGIVGDKLNSIKPNEINLTGNYTTVVEPYHKVAIIGKISKSSKEVA